MKTFLINKIKDISTINRSLDIISLLKSNEWIIFDEDKSNIEKFLFIDNENIYVSTNGNTSNLKWEYLKINNSLLIDDNQYKILFKVVVCNEEIIVLNIDSTNKYCFFINSTSNLKNGIYEDIQWYLMRKCGFDILNREQKVLYLEEQRKIEAQKEEEERKEKLETEEYYRRISIVGIILFIALVLYLSTHGI